MSVRSLSISSKPPRAKIPSSLVEETGPVAIVTPPCSPDRSCSLSERTHVDIIPDEDLNSVLGLPGELDLSDDSSSQSSQSSHFVLQPLVHDFHEEFDGDYLDPLWFW